MWGFQKLQAVPVPAEQGAEQPNPWSGMGMGELAMLGLCWDGNGRAGHAGTAGMGMAELTGMGWKWQG